MSYILAIDQGTTGSRAYLFDKNVRPMASSYREFRQYYPKPGWVEHDAEEIWNSVKVVISHALKKARLKPAAVSAIGITNQRETMVLWDRVTSRPFGRAIVWQCRRTADFCEYLKKRGHAALFREKTGLVIDPYFSGTKIRWMFDHMPAVKKAARDGRLAFGTIDTWLVWKLTGGRAHVTDMTNAARTLCFDIHKQTFSKTLCGILGVPLSIFPEVKASAALFGKTAARTTVLPSGVPITGMAGDQQAALFGQGCVTPGTIKNTYGTGSFVVLNTGKRAIRSRHGFLTTLACDENGKACYALEGSVFISGAAVQWLRDELKIITHARETEAVARSTNDTGGVYVVPAFVGLGAPYWNSRARGLITGLTRGSGRREIIRATLESIAYQTKDVISLMEKEWKKPVRKLRVDGGATSNNFLMQFQADLLDVPILRPIMLETTARGAALLAGLTIGLYGKKYLTPRIARIFKPRMAPPERKRLYIGWVKAVARAQFDT